MTMVPSDLTIPTEVEALLRKHFEGCDTEEQRHRASLAAAVNEVTEVAVALVIEGEDELDRRMAKR